MNSVSKSTYIETKEKQREISPRDEAYIKIIPVGLQVSMTRNTRAMKQDIWRTARRNGWLTS